MCWYICKIFCCLLLNNCINDDISDDTSETHQWWKLLQQNITLMCAPMLSTNCKLFQQKCLKIFISHVSVGSRRFLLFVCQSVMSVRQSACSLICKHNNFKEMFSGDIFLLSNLPCFPRYLKLMTVWDMKSVPGLC